MTSLQDLHDPSKTCVILAAQEDLDDDESYSDYEPFASRDFPGGYELRLKAYREAWQKCLDRVQTIVHELNAPLVTKVVELVESAYTANDTLPGLPYPELPVIGISASGGKSTILPDVLDILQDENPQSSRQSHTLKRDVIVSHIHPANCPNLTAFMRTLVTGFVDRQDEDGGDEDETLGLASKKRKATTSLANYDIRLLVAWYVALFKTQEPGPQLVVVLHDFEQLTVAAVQDMFYICSQHVPRLPLIFLLELSSPPKPSYLHTNFTRSTLALLRLQIVISPSGMEIVREVVNKTFFELDFSPDVMLGPGILDCLIDYTTRQAASVDIVLSILQLAYLQHFEEPLTILVHDTHLGCRSRKEATKALQRPESFQFLDTLLTRIWHDVENLPQDFPRPDLDWRQPSVADLLDIVEFSREESKRRVEQTKLGYQVLKVVQDFVVGVGNKGTRTDAGQFEMLSGVVLGQVKTETLSKSIQKLTGKQLDTLLLKLHELFQSLSSRLRRQEEQARTHVVSIRIKIPQEALQESETAEAGFQPAPSAVSALATTTAEWFTEYIQAKVVKLNRGILWDIWNTGMTPFPSELLNPAPRPALIDALLHPYNAVDLQRALIQGQNAPENIGSSEEVQRELWELPDISILFRRYMEAGRRINVFDWYESFTLALETQRQQLRKRERLSQNKRGKGKGRARRKHADETDEDDEGFDSKEDEEKWKVEVQARFIRSLHELDFMGFLKHTNRKADHVMRTIYDIPD